MRKNVDSLNITFTNMFLDDGKTWFIIYYLHIQSFLKIVTNKTENNHLKFSVNIEDNHFKPKIKEKRFMFMFAAHTQLSQ